MLQIRGSNSWECIVYIKKSNVIQSNICNEKLSQVEDVIHKFIDLTLEELSFRQKLKKCKNSVDS